MALHARPETPGAGAALLRAMGFEGDPVHAGAFTFSLDALVGDPPAGQASVRGTDHLATITCCGCLVTDRKSGAASAQRCCAALKLQGRIEGGPKYGARRGMDLAPRLKRGVRGASRDAPGDMFSLLCVLRLEPAPQR